MTEPLVLRGPEGSITVPAAVIEQLVVSAAESVGGARVRRPRRSVELLHADGRASVSLGVAVPYGAAMPELARMVQERVAQAVAATCGLETDHVDVTIEEVNG